MEISSTISEIQGEREQARHRKLQERRRAGARPNKHDGRGHLQLERVRCGKKGCKKCSGEHPELHGPYCYLYRPKKGGQGRTSEYIGKVLAEALAVEFGVPEERRRAE